ncbi:response regulator transcription factor [Sphingomonas sp. AAP5]|jgi:DNA-binding NarL/FixJ family response regulator|uniref:response regulator n=2 Tax=unclassified Sphingomonas TaxID=196159 RepID=UPI0010571EBF|nr:MULTISPECIES: response regulator transcription factor [unclassified Sphingomonas]MDY7524742.1 response regulator transcription factor [Sphingomonas sp. 10B4]MEB0281271.1 response regulator transcription factor [Sphingomonas sp. 10B4]QBM74408.1 response regulator transcription factor [Sphingomonas sp. AAP5]
MTTPPSILVVDDHPICAAALSMASRAVDGEAVVTTVSTMTEVETALRERRFDLVLLDLMLPDVNGLSGLAMVRSLSSATPVAIVSGRDDMTTIRQGRGLGAKGFISKSAEIDEMIAAIRVILAGGQWFPDAAMADGAGTEHEDLARRLGELSTAQLRVLRAIAGGQQNKQIAYELGLAEPTIKSHLAAIFRKLAVGNRTQAVLAFQALEARGDETP